MSVNFPGASFTPIVNGQWPASIQVSSRPSSATEPTGQSNDDLQAVDDMLAELNQMRLNIPKQERSDTPIPTSPELNAANEKNKVPVVFPPELALGFSFNSSVYENAMDALVKFKMNVGSQSEIELKEQGISDREIQGRKIYRKEPISESVKAFFDRNIGMLERELVRMSVKYEKPQSEESLKEDFDIIISRMEHYQCLSIIAKQVEDGRFREVTFMDLNGEKLPYLFVDQNGFEEDKLNEAALIANFYDCYINDVLDPLRDFLSLSILMKIQMKKAASYTLSAQKV